MPERHLSHYIQSSRLYYDYNYFDSKIGFGVISEGEFKRTPYVINFEFNLKKIVVKEVWTQIF